MVSVCFSFSIKMSLHHNIFSFRIPVTEMGHESHEEDLVGSLLEIPYHIKFTDNNIDYVYITCSINDSVNLPL